MGPRLFPIFLVNPVLFASSEIFLYFSRAAIYFLFLGDFLQSGLSLPISLSVQRGFWKSGESLLARSSFIYFDFRINFSESGLVFREPTTIFLSLACRDFFFISGKNFLDSSQSYAAGVEFPRSRHFFLIPTIIFGPRTINFCKKFDEDVFKVTLHSIHNRYIRDIVSAQ